MNDGEISRNGGDHIDRRSPGLRAVQEGSCVDQKPLILAKFQHASYMAITGGYSTDRGYMSALPGKNRKAVI